MSSESTTAGRASDIRHKGDHGSKQPIHARGAASGWCQDDGLVAGTFEPALVPELLFVDVDRSLVFWRGVCGFQIPYSRAEEHFAYIALGSARLVLEQICAGRNWITGLVEVPLGRSQLSYHRP
jgi:hypothetical protein